MRFGWLAIVGCAVLPACVAEAGGQYGQYYDGYGAQPVAPSYGYAAPGYVVPPAYGYVEEVPVRPGYGYGYDRERRGAWERERFDRDRYQRERMNGERDRYQRERMQGERAQQEREQQMRAERERQAAEAQQRGRPLLPWQSR